MGSMTKIDQGMSNFISEPTNNMNILMEHMTLKLFLLEFHLKNFFFK